MSAFASILGSSQFLALTVDQRTLLFREAVIAGLLLVGVLVTGGVILLSLSARKRRTDEASPPATREDIASIELLTKASVAQNEALATERDIRRKAQDDAQFKDVLLNRSLEERVRLARDLHDGIIQSLYAAGLTLESVRRLIAEKPAEAEAKLADAVKTLNGAIRDVRTCLTGLDRGPAATADIRAGLELALDDLRRAHAAAFDLRVDESVGMALLPEQITEILQIAREAASNALRHGRASMVTIRLESDGHEACLLIQDNGEGFVNSDAATGGRGLTNMRGRAAALGGDLRVTSRPAEGTRVVLLVPLVLAKTS